MNRQQASVAAVNAHLDRHGAEIISEFCDLLALPNVSADLDDVRAVATHISTMLESRGIAPQLVTMHGAAPIVSGRIHIGDHAPTIGIYAHYDGQPVDEAAWASPPFDPTIFDRVGTSVTLGETVDPDWRIRARSASDDKAPIQAFVSAVDALAAAGVEPAVNVVLLFEGEEEAGSPHLREYLEQNAEMFAADMWLICDGPVHQTGHPQVIFGVRGIAQIDITVLGPTRGLHSGHYGNWIPNPTWKLVHLLASMRDAQGNALIEGFYSGVVPPTPAEMGAVAEVPAYEDELLRDLGVRTPEGGGESHIERMFLPSLNLRGFAAGRAGADAANVLPDSATASFDIRLPPGHDPDEMLDRVEAHVAAQGFHVMHEMPDRETRLQHDSIAVIDRDPHYTGMRVPLDGREGMAVLDAARAAAEGEEVVAMPTLGGSVPIVHFADVLGAPTIITPMANHDNNQHDANENIRIGNLWYGIRLMASLLTTDYRPE